MKNHEVWRKCLCGKYYDARTEDPCCRPKKSFNWLFFVILSLIPVAGFSQTYPEDIEDNPKSGTWGDSVGVILVDTITGEYTHGVIDFTQDVTISGDTIRLADGGQIVIQDWDKHIYGEDGSISENRVFDMNVKQLLFDDGGHIRVNGITNELMILNWANTSSSFTYMGFWKNGSRAFRIFGGASHGLTFYNDSQAKYQLALEESGRVGIGTSAAATDFDVYGDVRFSDYGEGNKTTSTSPYLIVTEADGDFKEFAKPTSGTKILAQTSTGNLFWKVDDTLNPDSVATDGYISSVSIVNDSLKFTGEDQAFTGNIDLSDYANDLTYTNTDADDGEYTLQITGDDAITVDDNHLGENHQYVSTTRRVYVESGGLLVFDGTTNVLIDSDGNLGVGVDATEKLEVEGDIKIRGTNKLSFTNTSDQTYVRASASNRLAFGTNSLDRLEVNSVGHVILNIYGDGTNTGTEAYGLAVESSGEVVEIPLITNTNQLTNGSGFITSYVDSQEISISNDTISLERGGYVVLPTDDTGTDDQTLTYTNTDANDNQNQLQIEGHGAINIDDNHLGTNHQYIDGTRRIYIDDPGELLVFDATTNVLIDADGNLGVGVDATEKLEVEGNIKIRGSGKLSFTNTSDQTYVRAPSTNRLAFGTNSTDQVSINSIGNVTLESYGSGTHTGTELYDLAVTNTGMIIETSLDADRSNINELQWPDLFDISNDSIRISLSNDPVTLRVDLSPYKDNTDNQTLSIASNQLIISGGNQVSLAAYLDNTDGQLLSYTYPNLTISGGNSVDLSDLRDGTGTDDQTASEVSTGTFNGILTGNTTVEAALQDIDDLSIDPSSTNEVQTLSIASNLLSITLGNSVSLAPYLDNTDAQTLSYTYPNLTISGGNSVDLSDLRDGDTQLTEEQVEDFIGDSWSATNDGVDITYDDANGLFIQKLDINELAVRTVSSVSDYVAFYDASAGLVGKALVNVFQDGNTQRTDEEIRDVVGQMVSLNTETGITVTYDDPNNTLNFVAADISATNEIQTLGTSAGDILTLSLGGGSVDFNSFLSTWDQNASDDLTTGTSY